MRATPPFQEMAEKNVEASVGSAIVETLVQARGSGRGRVQMADAGEVACTVGGKGVLRQQIAALMEGLLVDGQMAYTGREGGGATSSVAPCSARA